MNPWSDRSSWFVACCVAVFVLSCGPSDPGTAPADVTTDVPETILTDVPDILDVIEDAPDVEPDGTEIECHQDEDCANFFPDMEACQVARCDNPTGAGLCVLETAVDGSVCDDQDLCSLDDTCTEGACAGTPRVCDDSVECTSDSCNVDTGECEATPTDTCECDESNPCVATDLCAGDVSCQDFACVVDTDTAIVCDDNDACTDDSCDPATGQCAYNDNGTCECDSDDQCQDDNLCDGTKKCVDQKCTDDPATVIVCDDNNACTDDTCTPDTGACLYDDNGTCECSDTVPCTDGNVCDGIKKCENNQCVNDPSTIIDSCDDNSPCTTDYCDPVSGCVNAPKSGSCEDGDPCSLNDQCVDGKCTAGSETNPCTDGNACTKDSCEAGVGCKNEAQTGPCSDGNACTEDDQCDDKAHCVGGPTINCEDTNVCTEDSCDPVMGCQNTPATVTQSHTITNSGTMSWAPTALSINAGDTVVWSWNGFHSVIQVADDTPSTTALAGGFSSGPASNGGFYSHVFDTEGTYYYNCGIHTPMHGSIVVGPAVGVGCDDKDGCTTGDLCVGTACQSGAPVVCDSSNDTPCSVNTCDPTNGACAMVDTGATGSCAGKQCGDDGCGNSCGTCSDDGNDCTTESCNANQQCLSTPIDGCCSDLSPCPDSGDPCMITSCTEQSVCENNPIADCCKADTDHCRDARNTSAATTGLFVLEHNGLLFTNL